jgi:hypothetical protein
MAAALMAAALVGCGNDQAAGARKLPLPTLGSAELSEVLDTTTSATNAEAAPVVEVVGPSLAGLSSAQDILVAVEQVHGPTSDAAAQMNRFVNFPPLPTPTGAVITELRADARATVDGKAIAVSSEVALEADGSMASLTDLYQRQLGLLGWRLTDRSNLDPLIGQIRLAFEIPDSPYQLDDLEITLRDHPSDANRALVRWRYVELAAAGDLTVRQRFEGWATGVPLPPGGEVTGAGIQTSGEGRHSLYFSLALSYPELDPMQVAAGVRSGLPTTEFSLDPRPPTGDALDNWVFLTSPFFTDAQVSTHGKLKGLLLVAPTTVNLAARVDFVPA